jgi:hypothetical protein
MDSAPWNLLFVILYTTVTQHTCASCEKRCVKVTEGYIMKFVAGGWNCSGSTNGTCSESIK